jgi:L-Ala-D/L-Glu epimerase
VASIQHSILELEKRVALTIARGTRTHSSVVWLRWIEDETEGWGEAVPLSVGNYDETIDDIVGGLAERQSWLNGSSALDRSAIERRLRTEKAPSALIAGISQALLDWTGKRLGQPVSQVLGLSPGRGPVTSVTVGISSPEAAQIRVRQWREVGDIRAFKIKLGSPAGIAADQVMFDAVRAEVGPDIRMSVDANGGWSVADACRMSAWLAERGVDHLEQPLPRGRERDLGQVRAASAIPVIVDESCFTSADVAALAGQVDGINIKLMKCGGLDEALRMISLARGHGLRLLVGCYGSTALGNTAAATLGSAVDYLDLDSHLNLKDDPFLGATFREGRLDLPPGPGFGISHDYTSV